MLLRKIGYLGIRKRKRPRLMMAKTNLLSLPQGKNTSGLLGLLSLPLRIRMRGESRLGGMNFKLGMVCK
jgi:hypothetical protein